MSIETDESWEARRAARARRDALHQAAFAVARAAGFPDPEAGFGFDTGHAAGFTVTGRRARRWHLDPACPRVPDGQRCHYGAPAAELDRFVHECVKADPCPACALPAVLAAQLAAAADPFVTAEVAALDGDTPEQAIVTCAQGQRAVHTRCADCARLAAAAATVDAPVHRDGDGFTVAALTLLPRWSWSFRRCFVVHRPPADYPVTLGRDGLAAAWTLRESGAGRLVEPRRSEWTGAWVSRGAPAWRPAAVIVPAGT